MAYRPVNDYDRAASAYIRRTAVAKKIGQGKTAERAGIPFGTFRRYWDGSRSMTLSDFVSILGALDVAVEQATEEIGRILEIGDYAD